MAGLPQMGRTTPRRTTPFLTPRLIAGQPGSSEAGFPPTDDRLPERGLSVERVRDLGLRRPFVDERGSSVRRNWLLLVRSSGATLHQKPPGGAKLHQIPARTRKAVGLPARGEARVSVEQGGSRDGR